MDQKTISMIDTIDARVAELEAYLAKVAEYKAELDELRLARRVIARYSGESAETFGKEGSFFYPGIHNAASEYGKLGLLTKAYLAAKQMTTKDAILLSLTRSERPWLTAGEVQSIASELKGAEIPMNTLSPMLSALRNEGLIVRNGLLVAHPLRVTDYKDEGARDEEPQ